MVLRENRRLRKLQRTVPIVVVHSQYSNMLVWTSCSLPQFASEVNSV